MVLELEPSFKCCTLNVWSKIIGYVSLALSITTMGLFQYHVTVHKTEDCHGLTASALVPIPCSLNMFFAYLLLASFIVTEVLLLVGLHVKEPRMTIPFMVVKLLKAIGISFMVGCLSPLYNNPDDPTVLKVISQDPKSYEILRPYIGLIIAILVLIALVQVVFFFIIYSTYRQMQSRYSTLDEESEEEEKTSVVYVNKDILTHGLQTLPHPSYTQKYI